MGGSLGLELEGEAGGLDADAAVCWPMVREVLERCWSLSGCPVLCPPLTEGQASQGDWGERLQILPLIGLLFPSLLNGCS